MQETNIRIDYDCNEKKKIIALTGKAGAGLEEIRDFLTSHRNFSALKRKEATNTNEFLTKIVKGDIIEAECDKNNVVWGTDISDLLTCMIYVGVYTPEQIANMRDSGAAEILPVYVHMNAENRLLHLLQLDCDPSLVKRTDDRFVIDACTKFLEDEKKYDDYTEYLPEGSTLFYWFDDHRDLDMQLKYASFILAIQKFNNEHKCITNLDNFI